MTTSEPDDLQLADPSAVVKAGAAINAMAGLFVALTGLQLVGADFHPEWLELIPRALLPLGIAQLALGAMMFRARAWAGFAACVLAPLSALVILGWVGFLTSSAAFTCIGIVTIPATGLAALGAFVSLPGIRATAAARQRLSDQGLGLGL